MQGDKYYAQAADYSRSLASLAALASDDAMLCSLSAGWKQAREAVPPAPVQLGDPPLAVVINELSSGLFATLENLERGRFDMLIVFLDPLRRCMGDFGSSGRKVLKSYPGIFAAYRGILYPPPVEASNSRRLTNTIALLCQERGIKILHILGDTEPDSERRPDLKTAEGSRKRQILPDISNTPSGKSANPKLEIEALKRMAQDLQEQSFVSCLWAGRRTPLPAFRKLGARLRMASPDGVVMQAVGMAASGIHPLIVISAADVPRILSELFSAAPFPITILIIDSGLTAYGDLLPNANRCDLAMLRSFEHIAVGVPADEEEARSMLASLLRLHRPGLIRMTSAPAVGIPPSPLPQAEDKCLGSCMKEGSDLSFVCLGTASYMAILAAQTLKSWGYGAGVYNMAWLNPLDEALMLKACASGKVITIEEHAMRGGLRSAAAEFIASRDLGSSVKLRSIALKPDIYSTSLEDHGISMDGLLEQAKLMLNIR